MTRLYLKALSSVMFLVFRIMVTDAAVSPAYAGQFKEHSAPLRVEEYALRGPPVQQTGHLASRESASSANRLAPGPARGAVAAKLPLSQQHSSSSLRDLALEEERRHHSQLRMQS